MSLATIAAAFDAFAEGAVSDAIAEGKTFVAQEVGVLKDAAEATLKNGYTDFLDLVNKVGQRASDLVTALMGDDSLSGLEKANLAATQLVQASAEDGITMAEQDVTAIIKSAYVAVTAKIASL